LRETATMEINRNQWMMIGLVILALGIQFRMVDSFVLNAKTTEIIAKRLHKNDAVATTFMPAFNVSAPPSQRVIKPPRWLGFMLISVGAVLMLHSLAMPKPG
jgi:hypothetical protein